MLKTDEDFSSIFILFFFKKLNWNGKQNCLSKNLIFYLFFYQWSADVQKVSTHTANENIWNVISSAPKWCQVAWSQNKGDNILMPCASYSLADWYRVHYVLSVVNFSFTRNALRETHQSETPNFFISEMFLNLFFFFNCHVHYALEGRKCFI